MWLDMGLYVLDGHTPVPEPRLERWAIWFQDADRHVRLSEQGDTRVSTVFLGLDHGWGDGPALLFETMAFVGDDTVAQERYATWAEAEEGHARHVDAIFRATPILKLPTSA
jgi:hypothetical protein